jgi:hypothetical protein
MTNLTITVDEEVLRKARMRALEEGTSVNKLLREHLTRYAESHERREQALKRLLALSRKSKASSGGKRTPREELYKRR